MENTKNKMAMNVDPATLDGNIADVCESLANYLKEKRISRQMFEQTLILSKKITC